MSFPSDDAAGPIGFSEEAKEMNAPKSQDEVQVAFRQVRQTVLGVLGIFENPDSTPEDARRACTAIRDVFELYREPSFGMNDEERELGAPTTRSARDWIGGKGDSQESAFWDKVLQTMKSKAITQVQLAARLSISQPAISQLLNRRCRPQRSTIMSFARALEVDPRELWPDLDVADILDTVAAVQEERTMSDAEADVIRRALKRAPSKAPASPLPKRKR